MNPFKIKPSWWSTSKRYMIGYYLGRLMGDLYAWLGYRFYDGYTVGFTQTEPWED